ncbi:MAG: FHA domain-containing protein [Myxococcota bacterium]
MLDLYVSEPDSGEIRRRRWAFAVISGPDAGHRFIPDRSPALAGAAPSADLCLSDETVSRLHAEIDLFSGGIRVRDLQSTNGTWRDGERTRSTWLGPRDRFGLGETRLQIIALDTPAVPPPMPAESDLVAVSESTRRVARWVSILAGLDDGVALVGPRGSGRRTWARRLHEISPRRDGPFVEAFAGRPDLLSEGGPMARSEQGTLLLDTPGALDPGAQLQLLEALDRDRAPRVLVRDVAPIHGQLVHGLGERLAPVHLPLDPLSHRPADLEAWLRRLAAARGMRSLGAALNRWRRTQPKTSFESSARAFEDASPEEETLRAAVLEDLLRSFEGDVDAAARALAVSSRELFAELSRRDVPIPE